MASNKSSAFSATPTVTQRPPQPLSMTPYTPRTTDERCPIALQFGTGWYTRCRLPVDHPRNHDAFGPVEWPGHYIQWFPGDPKEFHSPREDTHAWQI